MKPFVNHIYAINNVCNDRCEGMVTSIPIGFSDNWADQFTQRVMIQSYAALAASDTRKEHLLYLNFRLNSNKAARHECHLMFHDKEWVTKGQYGTNMSTFYETLYKSEYILSPVGAGPDCHRTYEAIYFDVVPIVLSSPLDTFYASFPIVIVEKWSDVSEDFLQNNRVAHSLRLKEWKVTHPNWTSAASYLHHKQKRPPNFEVYPPPP